jgi:tetratricopeptide (TPR) repeat protein
MNRFLKFLVCLLLLLPCCVAGGKPVLLLLQPQSWGLLAFTATLVLLLLHATWRSPGCWDLRAVLLLAIWCLLLPVAFYRSSVWLAHVTFCVAAAIAGKSLQPSRRTQLFVVLPALLAGLPPFLNKPLQKWLSEQIIQQTSVAASLQGIWHHREGTLLTASSGSVDLGPILNSPLSISGLLVVMCVWMGFRRLPTAQILVAVPLAACVAVMLPVGSCLIAIRDLADGGQLMSVLLWLLLLAGTLLLLYSATLLSKLLTNAITPPDDRFQEHIEENPLVQLWDRIIGGRTSEYAEPIRFLSENRKRLAPTVRPIEFLKDWFFSRRPRLLLQSVPALLALCALLMANGSLASRQNSILSRYQAQVELSRKNADLDQQEICLRGLASLAPADVGGRLRLAEFLWEQRGRETGWKEYERLAQLEGAGGAAAHLWIARHAMSWRPLRELSDEEIIQHLRRALESGEYAAEAHALLARIYLRNNEVTLAGQHLRKAADADIRYLDELIMFHRQQGIPMPAEERIPKRVRELELMVEQRPDDVSVRLDFATLLDALGDHRKAMLTVSEGRRLNDSEVLREAAAELLLNAARSEISTAVVGGDQCLLAVRNALQLNPKNAEAPRLAALLRLEGAAFAGSIDDALLYWREQVRETESDVAIRCLALLAFAAGEPEESLESFKRLRQPTFGDADVRIAAHIQLRQSQEALSFAQAFSENLSKMPSAAAKLAAAQLLSRARAFDLAIVVSHSDGTLSSAALARFTFSMMSAASLVHTKVFGLALCSAI